MSGFVVERALRYLPYLSGRPAGWSVADGLVRVFGLGSAAVVRDLVSWNEGGWRGAYGVLSDLLLWGENVFGDQFGVDESGRICVIRCEGGEMEVGHGAGFDEMLDEELARLHTESGPLLASVRRSGLWPSVAQHVGFAIPLVVGGRAEIENVEVVDAETHLAILAEIVAKTRAVPDGTKITQFVDS